MAIYKKYCFCLVIRLYLSKCDLCKTLFSGPNSNKLKVYSLISKKKLFRNILRVNWGNALLTPIPAYTSSASFPHSISIMVTWDIVFARSHGFAFFVKNSYSTYQLFKLTACFLFLLQALKYKSSWACLIWI